MPVSPEFQDHLLDLLADLGPVQARRMFGGGGLFLDGTMFALMADDALYLKADDDTVADFEAAGSAPFTYEKNGKPVALSYWEAPADILDDGETLCAWAERAWQAARRAAAVKAPKRAEAGPS